ncbi:MAG: GntR family transcriptional regulator [Sedimentisphaeraceae bacterium JB056]
MFSHLTTQTKVDHQVFANEIMNMVNDGRLAQGNKLPTLSEMCLQTGLANYSVRKAINTLVDSGVLETEQGGGIYVSGNNTSIRVAVADAFRFSGSCPELRHPRTISGVYSSVNEKTVVDLLRPDTDFTSSEEILEQVYSHDYKGIIWLYPEDDRIECMKKLSREIPLVITSHSRVDLDLPTVESDEAWNAVKVGRHFLDCKTPKVVQFVEPWMIRDGGIHSGGHRGGINSLKMTLLEGGYSNFNLVAVEHSEIKYRDTFIEAIEALEDHSGVFLANTTCFQAMMEADFERVVKNFSRLNVVIATTMADNNFLAPLAQRVHFLTCVNPLKKIGELALQKITNLLSGMNEDTSTIVRIKFGNFEEIHVDASTSAAACAV